MTPFRSWRQLRRHRETLRELKRLPKRERKALGIKPAQITPLARTAAVFLLSFALVPITSPASAQRPDARRMSCPQLRLSFSPEVRSSFPPGDIHTTVLLRAERTVLLSQPSSRPDVDNDGGWFKVQR